jgi:molecular chaperone IbpA
MTRNDLITDMVNMFEKSSIGFNNFLPSMVTSAGDNFPRINVIKDSESKYTLQVAVAGFNKDELQIDKGINTITISGNKEDKVENYIYKGISTRSFKKTIPVANGVDIEEANVENGILNIYLSNQNEEIKSITIK